MNARFGRATRRIVLAAAWLAVAVLLSAGVAGVIGAMNRSPATGSRPELTYAADEAVRPELDAAAARLAGLARGMADLSAFGRLALTRLLAGDLAGVQAAIDEGRDRAADLERGAGELRVTLDGIGVDGLEAGVVNGSDTRARYGRLVAALAATDRLQEDWERLAVAAVPPMELARALDGHDREAAAAVREGGQGRYREALALLARAAAELRVASAIRDELAKTVDVDTLDEWIERNAALDGALQRVYEAIVKSSGRSTPELRSALDALRVARANLPPDTRALVIILGDAAQGGLNQAVIEIEQARAQLEAASRVVGPGRPAGEPAAPAETAVPSSASPTP